MACSPPRIAPSPFLIAALLTFAACTPASRPPVVPSARADFANAHTCPLHRVEAHVVDESPPPPARIASDPERLAMWRQAAARRVPERQIVAVSGCEERATYACWEYRGTVPARRRGLRSVSLGAVCIEEEIPY